MGKPRQDLHLFTKSEGVSKVTELYLGTHVTRQAASSELDSILDLSEASLMSSDFSLVWRASVSLGAWISPVAVVPWERGTICLPRTREYQGPVERVLVAELLMCVLGRPSVMQCGGHTERRKRERLVGESEQGREGV